MNIKNLELNKSAKKFFTKMAVAGVVVASIFSNTKLEAFAKTNPEVYKKVATANNNGGIYDTSTLNEYGNKEFFSGINGVINDINNVFPVMNQDILNGNEITMSNPYAYDSNFKNCDGLFTVGTWMYNTLKPISVKLASTDTKQVAQGEKEFIKYIEDVESFFYHDKPIMGVKYSKLNGNEQVLLSAQVFTEKKAIRDVLNKVILKNDPTKVRYSSTVVDYKNDVNRVFVNDVDAVNYAKGVDKEFKNFSGSKNEDLNAFVNERSATDSSVVVMNNFQAYDFNFVVLFNKVSVNTTTVYTTDLINAKLEFISKNDTDYMFYMTVDGNTEIIKIGINDVKDTGNSFYVDAYEVNGVTYAATSCSKIPVGDKYPINNSTSLAYDGAKVTRLDGYGDVVRFKLTKTASDGKELEATLPCTYDAKKGGYVGTFTNKDGSFNSEYIIYSSYINAPTASKGTTYKK